MNKIIFITGASGSGKTTIVKELQRATLSNLQFCYFDSVGIPSPESMLKEFGSAEEWQRQTTIKWVKEIKAKYLATSSVVFDGQMRLAFVLEACKSNHVDLYDIVLLDCSDEERNKRLVSRGQAELATGDMANWAAYLRNEAMKAGHIEVLDTTRLEIDEAVKKLQMIIENKKTFE